MSAFNRRFQAPEISGLPLYVAIGLVGMLLFGVAILLSPLFGKLLFSPFFLASVGSTWAGFHFGDDIRLVPVILAARNERNRVTCETWSAR